MRQVTKEIQDDELLVAFAVPKVDTPKLVEAICANNGYPAQVENPDYLGNKPESETNLRFIPNTQDPKEFTMMWIIKMVYAQLEQYSQRLTDIQRQKEQEELRKGLTISAKPVI
jgi:hypothetical protein